MITYIGSLSVGGCMPAVSGAIASAYADLQARVNALLAFAPSPVVTFSAQLALLATMTANVELMIAAGISPPSITAQIAIIAAELAALEVELAAILGIQNAFGAAGVFAYAYAGRADAFGGELSGALATGFPGGFGADHTNALVLATTTPACWAAMQVAFKTTP